MASKIEYVDLTLNPVVGCSKCSPGCENCYAEKFAARLAKNPNPKISRKYASVVDEHGKWTGQIWLDQSFLSSPKTANPHKKSATKLRRMVFVGSMCDLFNLDAYVHFDQKYSSPYRCNSAKYVFNSLWNYFAKNPQNTFLLLTKRPAMIARVFKKILDYWPERTGETWPLPNVWLGVTVCNQQEADEKIPILLDIPATTRFISVEPMLERIDLSKFLESQIAHEKCRGLCLSGSNDGRIGNRCTRPDLANSLPERESLDAPNPYSSMPKETRRKINGEISTSASNDRRSPRECPCASACMDSLQRPDSAGADNKPQEWDHLGQSSRKSGAGNIFGTTAAFVPCSENTTQTRSSGQISWVICGAETGSSARPMNLQWARALRDQCKRACVPFFFKKAGNKTPIPDDLMVREFPSQHFADIAINS